MVVRKKKNPKQVLLVVCPSGDKQKRLIWSVLAIWGALAVIETLATVSGDKVGVGGWVFKKSDWET